MGITKKLFGKIFKDKEVYIFTLSNDNKMSAKISNYGGSLVSLTVPDKEGRLDDIVLGYKNLDGYVNGKFFFGAIIGRNANRIKDAKIKINDRVYNLTKNEGENQLHGGIIGFNKVLWIPRTYVDDYGNNCLELSYMSKDGEEGYPGDLNVKVIYTLKSDNELKIDYFAVSDKDTVVNLTNHSYFNLSGHLSKNILAHQVMINSDKFTVNSKESIPTGEIRSVDDTPMDFRKLTTIGKNISSKYDQIIYGNGYDHNWILNKKENSLEMAAEVFDHNSGRVMKVYTTKPAVQFYTGNYLNNLKNCKDNACYTKNSALCLETQYFPDALNHSNFPSSILKAREQYRHTTVYKFLTI
ncbi:aldose epimerase family protein [Clostridium scatologenes]|uniref:Aldose 1-epimerase n=1 Tax=Clostridium scatologenes TaxID=1548 RepID=A0A0E3K163_CLOSL|nr:aldose epimerase family protein [Clostridium scatologenes]AKA69664.1 aldose 1-epimerase [Clostridium scatologenes]